MKQNPKQGSRLWWEMKRRGVPKVLAMYAAGAFIAIEASDIILPRLGLPEWIVTLMIILLIIGFPLAFILSWVFDITPQGVIKTSSQDNLPPTEEEKVSRRRRLKVSDVVIGLLLVTVVLLAYPKIFGRWDPGVPKDMRGKISIAVMPFKNMTGDSVYNLWQEGLQNLVITSLSNSQELSVHQFETMNSVMGDQAGVNYASLNPSSLVEIARKVEANTIISGSMHKSGQKVRITANIMNAADQEIFKSFEMEGPAESELFSLADSLSFVVRDFLELKKIKQSQVYEMAQVFTSSPEAYKLYLQGVSYHNRLDYTRAVEYYNKAIQVDSNFVSAMMKLAYCYGDQRHGVLTKHWAYEAFERIDRLPLDMQLRVHSVKAVADKKPLEQLDYIRQYLQIHPNSAYMVYNFAWVNFNLENWEEAINNFEKSITLVEKLDVHAWAWTYILLGGAYHNTASHKLEEKTFNRGKELWPDQKATFDYWQCICAIEQEDSLKTEYYLGEITQMIKQKGWPETFQWIWFAGAHAAAGSDQMAEDYYRRALSLKPSDPYVVDDVARFLISSDVNVKEGLDLITPVIESNPENAAFLYTYAMGLHKTGELDKAYNTIQKSWELTPYYNHKRFTLKKEIGDQLDKN